MPEVWMDYDEVGRLAGRVDDAQSELAGGRDSLASAPAATRGHLTHYVDDFNAFGNTYQGTALAGLHDQVREAAQDAAENLASALGEDVLRLEDVVHLFRQNDHEQADQLASIGTGDTLNVFSTHVHSGGAKGFVLSEDDGYPVDNMDEATANDYMRGYQINRLGEVLQESPGVVGADLNTDADPDGTDVSGNTESWQAVEGLQEDGFATDAGQVDQGTHNGRHIDYVIVPPGVSTQEAEWVDGDPFPKQGELSDHDGQRVDLTVGRW